MSDVQNLRGRIDTEEQQITSLVDELVRDLDLPVAKIDWSRISHFRSMIGRSFTQIQGIMGEYSRIPKLPQIQANCLTDAHGGEFIKIERYFSGVRYRATLWIRLANSIEKIQTGSPVDLVNNLRTTSLIEMQHNFIMGEMYSSFHSLANPRSQDTKSIQQGMFADIALSAKEFVEYAHGAYRLCLAQRRALPVRFLDVGCGGGTKVIMASSFFGQTDGLEYDEGYFQSAQATFAQIGPANSQIIHGDALKFENYIDYNVIYFYRPIADPVHRLEMEDRITQNAKKGTILIAPFNDFGEGRLGLNCAHIAGPLYVVGYTDEEAAELLAAAELTGVGVPARGYVIDNQTAYMKPIVALCIARGYVL